MLRKYKQLGPPSDVFYSAELEWAQGTRSLEILQARLQALVSQMGFSFIFNTCPRVSLLCAFVNFKVRSKTLLELFVFSI